PLFRSRLAQKVGIMKAREMSFTAKTISGIQAESYGMANKSVPLESLNNYVEEIAKNILGNSLQTVAAIKHLYHKGSHTTLKDGLMMESAFNTDITDRTEYLRDFMKNKKQ